MGAVVCLTVKMHRKHTETRVGRIGRTKLNWDMQKRKSEKAVLMFKCLEIK